MADVTESYLNVTLPDNITDTPKASNSPWDDATWILTSAFIIFTMQSGFGLLESGMASRKNEVNIMMKNVVDVVFGGMTYWGMGYGLTFGEEEGSNPFNGVGYFFVNPNGEDIGDVYSKFVFQASFATTATTIVSGAMAERTKLMAYVVFSLLNTFVYSFPAHWVWAEMGWLKKMDVVDVAGVGPVHLVGGVTAIVAATMLKPRRGRFDNNAKIYRHIPSSNPVNALLGLFMLWWGWLGFNCGSTFGISGGKWKLATRAAANTILASCGGGITSFAISYIFHDRKFIIPLIVNGILGALVSISAICAVSATWAGVIIGSIGAMIAALSDRLLFRLKIDDPVGASSVHLFCSIWGLLCCGLFAQIDNIEQKFNYHNGLFLGGGFYLLGIQTLSVVVIIAWSAVTSIVLLKAIDLTIGLRVSVEEEIVGSDYHEHNILPPDGIIPTLDNSLDKDTQVQKIVADEKTCFCFIRKKTIFEVTNKTPDEGKVKKEDETCMGVTNDGFEGVMDEDGCKDKKITQNGKKNGESVKGENKTENGSVHKAQNGFVSVVDDIKGD